MNSVKIAKCGHKEVYGATIMSADVHDTWHLGAANLKIDENQAVDHRDHDKPPLDERVAATRVSLAERGEMAVGDIHGKCGVLALQ